MTTTFLGTLMAVSSNSWILCWIGLEINLMSFIPLILSDLNFKSTETAIKYFLTQAVASVILITAASFTALQMKNYYLESMNFFLFLALSIKAGLAPFHIWFPQVTEFISWFKCFIIFTWQKIAPFMLIINFNISVFTYFIIIMSATAGAVGGLNQMSSKILLTYSSISHSAWMLMLASLSLKFWTFYFLIYFFVLSPIIFAMNFLNFKKIKEINSSKINLKTKLMLSTLIMSLGGLPPFLGFLSKLIALTVAVKTFPMVIMITLVASSLVSLYFYTKMFFNSLTASLPEKKISSSEKKINKFIIFSLAGNLILSNLVLLI
uniref:NADH-ubiquinone oxidoreductase chain 2 n=2 Tax=Folsomia candida TaxID=158441 RepID=A0A1S5QM94_FOLCA|nr:NADH dehydrogenase subunit 2 [Folsomia candida]